MRDLKRIGLILDRLKQVWEEYPDLRLCQLICNVWPDPYYVEDDQLIKDMKHFYDSSIKRNKSATENFRNIYGSKKLSAESNNYCMCCSLPASQYGAASQNSEGVTMKCSREVCVPCLERACRCRGDKLKFTGTEVHVNCEHKRINS